MMDALLQTFWIVVGASLGIVLGISKEGADFVASLGSAQGWKQIYTGYTPKKMKKLDNGDSRHGTWKAAPVSGEESIKRFLGTRPPELKTSPPPSTASSYTSAPTLGFRNETSTAVSSLVASQPAQPATPMPFALPAGAQSQPILGDPLPDIFGASTSFMSNRPLSPTPVASKPLESSPVFSRPSPGIKPPSPVSSIPSPTAKSVEAAPVVSRPNPVISVPPTSRPSPIGSIPSPTGTVPSVSTSAVNGSPMSHASEEPATDDDDLSSAADETVSPEANLSTGSKMKKLRKRISSKLKGVKA